MVKNKLDQNGFSAVVVALIVVVVGIIGFTGWYVYNAVQKNNKQLDKTVASQSEPQKTTAKSTPVTKSTPSPSAVTSVTKVYESETFSLKYPDSWVTSGDGVIFFHLKGTTVLSGNDMPDKFFRVWPPNSGGSGHGGVGACFIEGTKSTTTNVTYDSFRGVKNVCESSKGSAVSFTFTEKLDNTAKAPNSPSGYFSAWFEFEEGTPIDENLVNRVMDSINIK